MKQIAEREMTFHTMTQYKAIALFLFMFLASQMPAQEQQAPSSRSQMLYKTMKSVNASEKAFDRLLNKPRRGTIRSAQRK